MTCLNLTLTQKHHSSLCGTVVVWYEGINLYPAQQTQLTANK